MTQLISQYQIDSIITSVDDMLKVMSSARSDFQGIDTVDDCSYPYAVGYVKSALLQVKYTLTNGSLSIAERLQLVEDKVRILEGENVETTNCLYEVENRLLSQIDAITNHYSI